MIWLLMAAHAAQPALTTRLADATGPLAGTHDLTVVVFDAADAGQSVYSQSFNAHPVDASGIARFVLADQALADESGTLWAEVQRDGVAVGLRTPVGWAPSAARADTWRGHERTVVLTGASRRWSDGSVADSCMAYLQPEQDAVYLGDTGDGRYAVDLGAGEIDVWCDMTTAGGGWMLFWKNGGASYASTLSNAQLLASPNASVVDPPTESQGSELHAGVHAALFSAPGREYMKRVWLWDAAGELLADSWFRMEMGATSLADMLSPVQTVDYQCHTMPSRISVFTQGGFAGSTDQIFRWTLSAPSFGFASDLNTLDNCATTADNQLAISGPLGHTAMHQGRFNWRHAISYVHTHSGTSRSRCFHYCWNATTSSQFSEAFVWGVR